jgi:hypothetical protein
VAEVSLACKEHRYPVLVAGRNDFFVFLRSTRLDDRNHPSLGRSMD